MNRREFLTRMLQAGLVVAAPKLIFDLGANKAKYPQYYDFADFTYDWKELTAKLDFGPYECRYEGLIVMGTPPSLSGIISGLNVTD